MGRKRLGQDLVRLPDADLVGQSFHKVPVPLEVGQADGDRYFPVIKAPTRIEELDEADGSLQRLVDSLEIQERDSLKQAQIGLDEKAGVVWTPWLMRTRWMERYEGMDIEELYKLTDKPNLGEEEDWMSTLWSDIGGTIRWCFEGLKDLHERQWDRISFWLASPN